MGGTDCSGLAGADGTVKVGVHVKCMYTVLGVKRMHTIQCLESRHSTAGGMSGWGNASTTVVNCGVLLVFWTSASMLLPVLLARMSSG